MCTIINDHFTQGFLNLYHQNDNVTNKKENNVSCQGFSVLEANANAFRTNSDTAGGRLC